MSRFSICPDRVGRAARDAALAAACVLAGTWPAAALDPARAPSQYLVDHWDLASGYPGGAVHAITQSSDGYLWIASERGLIRFDGVTFTLLVPPAGPAGTGTAVLGLAPDADRGGVWARLRGPMLVRRDQRTFERLDLVGEAYTVITAMRPGADGAMLLSPLGQGVLRVAHGTTTVVVAPAAMPTSFVIAMASRPDGTLWLGTRDAGLLRARDGHVAPVAAGLPDKKVNALEFDAAGRLWIATDRGVVRRAGDTTSTPLLPTAARGGAVLALAADRDGSMWLALGSGGVVRVTAAGAAASLPWEVGQRGEATTLFEDRDGQLWIGTNRGLTRIRDGRFRTFTTAQGLPSDQAGPILADVRGRIWMAPPEGGLFWLRDGVVHRVDDAGLDADVVYSITGQGDEVWVGRQRGGLSRIRLDGTRAAVTTFGPAQGLAQLSVFAVHQDRQGSVWAGTLSAGLSEWRDGAFTTYTTRDGLASNTVAAIADAADGRLWIGTPAGVSIRAGTGWQRLDTASGLPSSDVGSLAEDADGTMWIGTAGGLAYVRDGRVHRLAAGPLRTEPIVGLAQDHEGRLWVTTPQQVSRADPARLRAADLRPDEIRTFGPADGLASVEGVRRHRTVVADAEGAIWLSLSRGLSQLMPGRARPAVAPAALVEAALLDDEVVAATGDLAIPPGTRRLTLRLGAAALADVDRLRFRYRLDGFDAHWSAPTSSRDVVYTNLPPGAYAFRIVADLDGASDAALVDVGPALRLQVAPAYWQTGWFQGSVLCGLVVAGWGLYRWRVRSLSRQMDRAFEARLAERTRIAQHLHDTLLQGCLSASMHLHVIVDRLGPDAPLTPALTRVVSLMRQVVDDGRVAVGTLRTGADDLERALARAPSELMPDQPARVRVIAVGPTQPLRPVVRDEVYRIGREALANALRHADATEIEVELEYDTSRFRLSVRDDGKGMTDALLREGRQHHWGLAGMRERAQALGASLQVLSRPGAGTEVVLDVAAPVAYLPDPAGRPRRRWRRPFARQPAGTVGSTTREPRP